MDYTMYFVVFMQSAPPFHLYTQTQIFLLKILLNMK